MLDCHLTIVPQSLAEAEDALAGIMCARDFGAAGDEVVIERLLVGEEVSCLAFTDGERVALLPPAQDHKRVGDGDTGPNTYAYERRLKIWLAILLASDMCLEQK